MDQRFNNRTDRRGQLPHPPETEGELDAPISRQIAPPLICASDAASFEQTPRRDRKKVRAVRSLIEAGRIDEGAQLAYQAASGLADPVAVAQLRIMLSTIGLMRCRWEEATSHASAVLSEPGLAEHLYAEAKLAQLRSFMSEGNEIGLRSLVASIMGGDNRIGEAAALGAALVVSAKWAWDGGRPADAVAFLRAAIARADRSPRDVISGHPRLLLAAVLASLGVEPEARILINHSAEG